MQAWIECVYSASAFCFKKGNMFVMQVISVFLSGVFVL